MCYPILTSLARFIVGAVLLFDCCHLLAQQPPSLRVSPAFEANRGQFPGDVLFATRGTQSSFFVTRVGATFAIGDPRHPEFVRAQLVGVRQLDASGQEPLPGRVHYYRGPAAHWVTGVPLFAEVVCTDAWPGIDLVYHARRGPLEYDFEVAPQADPSLIRIALHGAARIGTCADGALLVAGHGGCVRHERPTAFQTIGGVERAVEVRWQLTGDTASFVLGDYDRRRPLVIDPVITWSTYLGGSGAEQDTSVVVDALGRAIVCGYTSSPDFPGGGFGGGSEVFVTMLSTDGRSIVWSTILGGSGGDTPGRIALLADGRVAVVGNAGSTTFPVRNEYQTMTGGGQAFITVLDQSGQLHYSSALRPQTSGGSSSTSVAVSGTTVFVGGSVGANRLMPVTAGAFQGTSPGGVATSWIAKIDPDSIGALSLQALTLLGGSTGQTVLDLAASAGSVYATGMTLSTDFPVTAPMQGPGGGQDGFVAVLDQNLATLAFGMRFGGSNDENAQGHLRTGIVPSGGGIWVAGSTRSTDFPVTGDAFRGTTDGADAFLMRLDPAASGGAMVYSTYFGGTGGETGQDLQVDATGRVWLAGQTGSQDYPTVAPLQARAGILADAYVAVFDPTGRSLLFSTPLGGTGADEASGLALFGRGALVTGTTESPDFPTTPGVLRTTRAGAACAFVTLLNVFDDTTPPTVTIVSPLDGAVIPTFSVAVDATVQDESATTVTSSPAGIHGSLPAGGGSVSGTVPLDSGPNVISVLAADPFQSGGTSVEVIVDPFAPALAFNAPLEGAVLDSNAVEVSLFVDDDTTTTVTLMGQAVVVEPRTGSNARFSLNLPDGAHSLTARAVDAAGHVTEVSRSFFVDTQGPVMTVLAPVLDEIGFHFQNTLDPVPVVIQVVSVGSSTLYLSDVGGTLFESPIPAGGGVVTTDLQVANESHRFIFSRLQAGPHVRHASFVISVDLDAPVVTVLSPAQGAMVAEGAVDFVVHANDFINIADVINLWVDLFVDGQLVLAATDMGSQSDVLAAITLPTELLGDGVHELRAEARDRAGNSTVMTRTITVDSTPPSIEVLSPANGQTVTGTMPFQVRIQDAIGFTRVEFTVNGVGDPTTDPSVGILAPLSPPVADLTLSGSEDTTRWPNGLLVLTITAVDQLGNLAQATVEVTIDNPAPTQLGLLPPDGATVRDQVTIDARWPGPGASSVALSIDGQQAASAPGNHVTYQLDTTLRPDGPVAVLAVATVAGQAIPTASVLTVDNLEVRRVLPMTLPARRNNGNGNGNNGNSHDGPVLVQLEGSSAAALIPREAHVVELRLPGGSPVPATIGFAGDDATTDMDNDGQPEVTLRFDRSQVVAAVRAGVATGAIPLQGGRARVLLSVFVDGHEQGQRRIFVVGLGGGG